MPAVLLSIEPLIQKTRCEVFTLEEPVDEAGQVSWREQDQWGHVAGSPLLRIRCI